MFKNKIVFVIGAGASFEVDIPISVGLIPQISRLLDIRFENGYHKVSGDDLIYDALKLHANNAQPQANVNDYLHKGWHIRDALPQATSIDNFFANNNGDEKMELCGKLAIVRAILKAEKSSLLYFDQRKRNAQINFSGISKSWYPRFWQLLILGIHVSQIEKIFSNLTLIIFNYDRCVEHFLFYSLQNYYGLDEQRAAEIMQTLSVVHPYGTVGILPWEKSGDGISFGGSPYAKQLLKISASIKTFSERVIEKEHLKKMQSALTEAENVIFLGFAYHPQNLDLIKPLGALKKRMIFGTGVGITASEQQLNFAKLEERGFGFKKHIQIHLEKNCADLFKEKRADFSGWKET